MMKKYIYVFVLFISLFLFKNSVNADYKATVVNPSNAKCSIKNTPGLCYYADSNLDSVGGIYSLDTGDEVTVLTNYDTVPTKDTNLCKDYYVYTSFYYSNKNKTYYGYYCNDNLSKGELSNELEEEFRNAGFPESYWEKLAILKAAHPNWNFVAINTNLDFQASVIGENVVGRSLVQTSASNNYAYFDSDTTSFNYYEDHFNERDGIGSSNPWCDANRETIAYYMDPRNFLSDMYIFQFEGLVYENTVSDDTYNNLITEILKGDYLSAFVNDFVTAGKESSVNPVYLASLSKQEVGGYSTATTAVSGNDSTYPGIYNFYNIGATGGERPVLRGLSTASNNDSSTLRPWNTEYKAIVGGAIWIGSQYINVGQDTSFFKKWNVVHDYLIANNKVEDPYRNYSHQYMTNVMAPSSEAFMTYKSYYNLGLLDSEFTFYIPVYNNMPTSTSLPNKGGWPNNYLKSLTINGKNVAGFDGEVETYNYYLDVNNPSIKLEASPVSSKTNISGLGTFNIDADTTKTIVVKAENGNTKTYKVNIKLTGEKLEDPVDVTTTLNNAGIKNSDKYLSGFSIGTDISYIKTKVLNTNSEAEVELKNSSGEEKSDGKLATGDKVTITVGSDKKEYEVVIYGDVNGDAKIAASDYVKIKNHIMGRATLSGVYSVASDVNKDGKIAASDYVKIKNHIMGKGEISQ